METEIPGTMSRNSTRTGPETMLRCGCGKKLEALPPGRRLALDPVSMGSSTIMECKCTCGKTTKLPVVDDG